MFAASFRSHSSICSRCIEHSIMLPGVAIMTVTTARFELLDYLRLSAALMVVAFHWIFNGIENGKVESIAHTPLAPIAVYGEFGVHLFFIISGFVISRSAEGRTAARFAVGRAIRLYPAFWAGMLATTAVVTLGGTLVMQVTVPQFLANLTMAPTIFRQPFIDGVYWTLLYELSFYLLIFLFLVTKNGRHLESFYPLWGIAMLAIALGAPQISGLPFLGGYYAFFAGGALLASIQKHGVSPMRLIGLAASVTTGVLFVHRNVAHLNDTRSVDQVPGVPELIVITLFALVALMLIPRLAALSLPLSKPMSDLTYPIYLLHAHIGYVVLNSFATTTNAGWVYAMMFVGLLVSAFLLHEIVEVRMSNFWFAFFDRSIGRFLRWVGRDAVRPNDGSGPAARMGTKLDPGGRNAS